MVCLWTGGSPLHGTFGQGYLDTEFDTYRWMSFPPPPPTLQPTPTTMRRRMFGDKELQHSPGTCISMHTYMHFPAHLQAFSLHSNLHFSAYVHFCAHVHAFLCSCACFSVLIYMCFCVHIHAFLCLHTFLWSHTHISMLTVIHAFLCSYTCVLCCVVIVTFGGYSFVLCGCCDFLSQFCVVQTS